MRENYKVVFSVNVVRVRYFKLLFTESKRGEYMKRISFLLLLSFLCTLNAQATDLRTIRNSVDEVDTVISSNARKLTRRQGLATDINNIIQEAKSLIEQRLNRNNTNQNGSIDMQLINVALQSCSNLNTYAGRGDCFKGYLQNVRGLLLDIKTGCEKVSSSKNRSSCYTEGLKAIKGSRTTMEKVVVSACSDLNTYSDRKECYSGMLKSSNEIGIIVLNDSCKAVSGSQNASNCYTSGLEVANVNENTIEVILNACKDLNTYSDRTQCYKGGVNSSENLGLNIKRYVRGCFNTSSSQQASNCFNSSLSAL